MSECQLGKPIDKSAEFCVAALKGRAAVVEITRKSGGRVFGYAVHNRKRVMGMSGGKDGSWRRLKEGFVNTSAVYCFCSSAEDAERIRDALWNREFVTRSDKDALGKARLELNHAGSAATLAQSELDKERRQMIELFTRKVDAKLAKKKKQIESLERARWEARQKYEMVLSDMMMAGIEKIGGRKVNRELLKEYR